RWPNEAVRHKVLDLLGDLGTLGVRPAGTVVIERGGHALHRLMARVAAGWR
ncbi:MAG: UDP-3-O-acyl-N-acetylglucosamine deacetylase, partial [Myxococcota bacterium]